MQNEVDEHTDVEHGVSRCEEDHVVQKSEGEHSQNVNRQIRCTQVHKNRIICQKTNMNRDNTN